MSAKVEFYLISLTKGEIFAEGSPQEMDDLSVVCELCPAYILGINKIVTDTLACNGFKKSERGFAIAEVLFAQPPPENPDKHINSFLQLADCNPE